jgi:hypothetical protein
MNEEWFLAGSKFFVACRVDGKFPLTSIWADKILWAARICRSPGACECDSAGVSVPWVTVGRGGNELPGVSESQRIFA